MRLVSDRKSRTSQTLLFLMGRPGNALVEEVLRLAKSCKKNVGQFVDLKEFIHASKRNIQQSSSIDQYTTVAKVMAPSGQVMLFDSKNHLAVPVHYHSLMPQHLDCLIWIVKCDCIWLRKTKDFCTIGIIEYYVLPSSVKNDRTEIVFEDTFHCSKKLKEWSLNKETILNRRKRFESGPDQVKLNFNVKGTIEAVSPIIRMQPDFFILELTTSLTCSTAENNQPKTEIENISLYQSEKDMNNSNKIRLIFRAGARDELRWHPFLRVGDRIHISHLKPYKIQISDISEKSILSESKVWSLLKLGKRTIIAQKPGGRLSSLRVVKGHFSMQGYSVSSTVVEKRHSDNSSTTLGCLQPHCFHMYEHSGQCVNKNSCTNLCDICGTVSAWVAPGIFKLIDHNGVHFLIIHLFVPLAGQDAQTKIPPNFGPGAKLILRNVHAILTNTSSSLGDNLFGERNACARKIFDENVGRMNYHNRRLVGFGLCMRSQIQIIYPGDIQSSSFQAVPSSLLKYLKNTNFHVATTISMNYNLLSKKFSVNTMNLRSESINNAHKQNQLFAVANILQMAISMTKGMGCNDSNNKSSDGARNIYKEFFEHSSGGCSLATKSKKSEARIGGINRRSIFFTIAQLFTAVKRIVTHQILNSNRGKATFKVGSENIENNSAGRPDVFSFEISEHVLCPIILDILCGRDTNFDCQTNGSMDIPRLLLLGLLTPLDCQGMDAYLLTSALRVSYKVKDATGSINICTEDVPPSGNKTLQQITTSRIDTAIVSIKNFRILVDVSQPFSTTDETKPNKLYLNRCYVVAKSITNPIYTLWWKHSISKFCPWQSVLEQPEKGNEEVSNVQSKKLEISATANQSNNYNGFVEVLITKCLPVRLRVGPRTPGNRESRKDKTTGSVSTEVTEKVIPGRMFYLECRCWGEILRCSDSKIYDQIVDRATLPCDKNSSSENIKRLSQQPPSNKKHKPGDWICVECGNMNFSWREVCHRCAKMKTSIKKSINQGDWVCNSCDNTNFSWRKHCHKCGMEMPRGKLVPQSKNATNHLPIHVELLYLSSEKIDPILSNKNNNLDSPLNEFLSTSCAHLHPAIASLRVGCKYQIAGFQLKECMTNLDNIGSRSSASVRANHQQPARNKKRLNRVGSAENQIFEKKAITAVLKIIQTTTIRRIDDETDIKSPDNEICQQSQVILFMHSLLCFYCEITFSIFDDIYT